MSYTPPTRTAASVDFTGTYTAPTRTAVSHNFLATGPQARAKDTGPLGEPAGVAQHIVGLRASDTGPLGVPLAYATDGTREAHAADSTGPLGAPAGVSTHSIGARAADTGPLGAPAALGYQGIARAAAVGPLGAPAALGWQGLAYASAASPLGAPATLSDGIATQASAPGPLGAPAALGEFPAVGFGSAASPLGTPSAQATINFALASAPGPLEDPLTRVVHDFSGALPDGIVSRYVMEITGTPTLRIPISSWQASLQTDRSNFVQAVIPAAFDYAEEILARYTDGEEFVIYRVAELPGGVEVSSEMCRAPIEEARTDRGPYRYTITLVGYTDGFGTETSDADFFTRTLSGIRSFSDQGSSQRIRCAIDWFLRPGYTAESDLGPSFEVSYLNFYVTGNDSYMDVGERAL